MTVLYEAPQPGAAPDQLSRIRDFEWWLVNQTVPINSNPVSFNDVCFHYASTSAANPRGPCAVESAVSPALFAGVAARLRRHPAQLNATLQALVSADGTAIRSRFLVNLSHPHAREWEAQVAARARAHPLLMTSSPAAASSAASPPAQLRVRLLESFVEQETGRAARSGDLLLYLLGLVLMCVLAVAVSADCTACGDSRMLVASMGIVASLFAVAIGFGLTALAGVHTNGLTLMAPFLVVAIGFDDTFLILSGLHHSHRNFRKDPRIHLAQSIGETCTAVSMTSFTDIVTFFVGSFSPIPAIRAFCITTSLCVLADYLLQVTFVVSIAYLDLKRARRGGLDCCCCCCKSKHHREQVHHSWWKRCLRRSLLAVYDLFSRRVPAVLLALLLATSVAYSALSIPSLPVGLSGFEAVPGAPYIPLTTALSAAFPGDAHGTTYLHMHRPTLATLPQLRSRAASLSRLPGVAGVDTSVLDDFSLFLRAVTPALAANSTVLTQLTQLTRSLPTTATATDSVALPTTVGAAVVDAAGSSAAAEQMLSAITLGASGGVATDADRDGKVDGPGALLYPTAMEDQSAEERTLSLLLLSFLRSPLFAHHNGTAVSLPRSAPSVAARASIDTVLRLRVTLTPITAHSAHSGTATTATAAATTTTTAAAAADVDGARVQRMFMLSALDSASMYVVAAGDPELEGTSVLITLMLQNMAFAAASVCLTLLITMTPRAVIVVVGAILLLDLLVFGAMAVLGLPISIYSFLNLVFSIGFSVDYTVHMVHTFMEEVMGSTHRRMRDTIATAGAPVFHGALTTVVGALPMAFGRSSLFQQFGGMIVVCASLGYALSLFVIPAVLGRWGPKPNAQEEYVPGRGGMRGW